MSQFKKILGFELKNNFNKVSITITVVFMILIALLLFIPRFFGGSPSDVDGAMADRPIMLVKSNTDAHTDILQKEFAAAFYNYNVKVTNEELDAVKNAVKEEKAKCAVVLTGDTEYTYYIKNMDIQFDEISKADSALLNVYRTQFMINSGVSQDQAEKIMDATITGTTECLGRDTSKSIIPTYVLLFLLFFVISIYGQKVATSVATEKSSRAMEMLITSAKPVNMLFGKIAAGYFTGLIQLSVIIATAIICFNINLPYYSGDFAMFSLLFNISPALIVYSLIFFLLGFFLYACLFGAFGSFASKAEQINTITMPITYLIIIIFFVTEYFINSSIDSPIMVVLSYIPFTSPLAMFARISMTSVAWYEILISILILAASVIGVGVLSAKIYRVGVLLYGNRPSLKTIFKYVRNS